MYNAGLLLALVLAQAGDRPAELRFLSAALTNSRDEPISGVTREELVVVENGVARLVASVERDTRPLTLAVLIDTSAAVANSYRLNIVSPVLRLLAQLPEGSSYTLWTTGDRPTRVSEPGNDPAAAKKALERIVPQGGSMLLETIVEAARALRKQEGGRRAMLIVSAFGPEFSSRDRKQVIEDTLATGLEVVSSVLIDEGAGADRDMRLDYEQTLVELSGKTGGLHERLLTSLAVVNALAKIAKDLGTRYRIGYATVPEIKERKIELKVARPGVRVRVGRPSLEKP
jgi:hypothetical protein